MVAISDIKYILSTSFLSNSLDFNFIFLCSKALYHDFRLHCFRLIFPPLSACHTVMNHCVAKNHHLSGRR